MDDDVILIIKVPKATREFKPVYINGNLFKCTFKRNNEGDYHCTEELVDMVRVDETPMHDAVREALVNCLVNADYFLPRGILIESYPDKIVMKNPGRSL